MLTKYKLFFSISRKKISYCRNMAYSRKHFLELFLQDNEQCLKALLDHDASQWKHLVKIISSGKNDESAACCDQLKKLLIDWVRNI
jgi:hypothetical protein